MVIMQKYLISWCTIKIPWIRKCSRNVCSYSLKVAEQCSQPYVHTVLLVSTQYSQVVALQKP